MSGLLHVIKMTPVTISTSSILIIYTLQKNGIIFLKIEGSRRSTTSKTVLFIDNCKNDVTGVYSLNAQYPGLL